MIDLILIILLIISISKPDILLSKKVRDKANEEQKAILAKNIRKTYGFLIALIETTALCRYVDEELIIVLLIIAIILLVLFFIFALPGIKENRKILKDLK